MIENLILRNIKMDNIYYEEQEDGHWDITLYDGSYCGTLEEDEDGLYYYLPVDFIGYWPSWFMRDLANKMDELNKPYESLEKLNDTFDSTDSGC